MKIVGRYLDSGKRPSCNACGLGDEESLAETTRHARLWEGIQAVNLASTTSEVRFLGVARGPAEPIKPAFERG